MVTEIDTRKRLLRPSVYNTSFTNRRPLDRVPIPLIKIYPKGLKPFLHRIAFKFVCGLSEWGVWTMHVNMDVVIVILYVTLMAPLGLKVKGNS